MQSLFDMVGNAQDGRAMDLLARQFDLSRQQTELAVEALMPAFSQGLKRNAADPYGVAAFTQALASGHHAQYFDNPGTAFSAAGLADGNGILGHLFGSKALSNAIAAQAAQATGISQEVIAKMLPVLAGMLMGGLFKQTTGQAKTSDAPQNPFATMFEEMMRKGGWMGTPKPQAGAQAASQNPFGTMFEEMFGRAQPAAATPSEPPAETYGKAFPDMLAGLSRPPAASDAPSEGRELPQAAANPYDALFGSLFDAGAKQRDDYQKTVEAMFDQFSPGGPKNR